MGTICVSAYVLEAYDQREGSPQRILPRLKCPREGACISFSVVIFEKKYRAQMFVIEDEQSLTIVKISVLNISK